MRLILQQRLNLSYNNQCIWVYRVIAYNAFSFSRSKIHMKRGSRWHGCNNFLRSHARNALTFCFHFNH